MVIKNQAILWSVLAAAAAMAADEPIEGAALVGPDVVYSAITSIGQYTAIGGIRAYILDSQTCNIGNVDLNWNNGGSPGPAMNAYRLYDGRLEQIGMSWVKAATMATAQTCSGFACNGHEGFVLGAGCKDVYTSAYNGSQGRLMPRSHVNPFVGTFGSIPGGLGNSIDRRLQIAESDLVAANFPGAQYFVEGHHISTDDAAAGNAMNNASYRRVTVSTDGLFNITVNGPMAVSRPAIYAWFDHGNGFGSPDPTVQIVEANVPGEGRFHVAGKVRDLGGGIWRYDYAVANYNSDRACGRFSVPVMFGVDVSNVGFHDVDYHSGETYDNTDWPVVVGPADVTWSSPETYDDNPDSNALRWATMYSYRFDADVPPMAGDVTLGLFKPGSPGSVTATLMIPSPPPPPIPTAGAWGWIVLTLSIATGGTMVFRRIANRTTCEDQR